MVGCHWFYKIKNFFDGGIEKNKEIFLAKGFSWRVGLNYDEKFSLVSRYFSIREVATIAT